jgi:hypothetical protein
MAGRQWRLPLATGHNFQLMARKNPQYPFHDAATVAAALLVTANMLQNVLAADVFKAMIPARINQVAVNAEKSPGAS